MSTINYHKREIITKIVYYGPGLGGKTSSLEYIHRQAKGVQGDLISLTTDEDRTLYFDYLPVELPKLGGFHVRVQLYTVPGQVYYNATRKLVLDGADGVVFVADSQSDRMQANTESLDNLCDNLKEKRFALKGMPQLVSDDPGADQSVAFAPDEISWIIQYNKRDLPNVMDVEMMESELNFAGVPSFETTATSGEGILEALQTICMLVLADVRDRGRLREGRTEKAEGAKGFGPADEAEVSMTATSLADITDVVSNLSENIPRDEEASALDPTDSSAPADIDTQLSDEPTTRPGVGPGVGGDMTGMGHLSSRPKRAKDTAVHAATPGEVGGKRATTSDHASPAPVSKAPVSKAPVSKAPVSKAPVSKAPEAKKKLDRPTSQSEPLNLSQSAASYGGESDLTSAGYSRLVISPAYKQTLVTLENQFHRGEWRNVVAAAHAAYEDIAAQLTRLKSGGIVIDPWSFTALWLGIPAGRVVSFRKLGQKLDSTSRITPEDAVFAGFFLADCLLRAEEAR